MCGIAAISLSPSSTIPIRQLAHELLLHSEERGKVASGFGFHYGGQNIYVKDSKPGGHLPLKLLPKDARTVIAHTRNATYGDPDENDNNHPVVDDREEIILVHNGVITNHQAIREGEKDVLFPEVDSSVLPWLVREEGVSGLQHVDGWAAVAWLDKHQPGTLNLARLKGNAPMVVVNLKDGSIVMGSTFPIIHASLIRVGYGDAIIGGYEVPDLTHIEVTAGRVGIMTNVPAFNSFGAKYKGKVMTHAEKQRLEKITSGDAVSYGKDTPVHAPPGSTYSQGTATGATNKNPPKTTPSAGSLVGAGVNPNYASPYAHGTGAKPDYESKSWAPKSIERKPGEDPMAAFDRAKKENPPPKTTVYSAGSLVGGALRQEHPIPEYLERRLRYWIKWTDTPTEFDEDIFWPEDFAADGGYLYNVFVDLVTDYFRRGLASQWGVKGEDGTYLYSHHLHTVTEEVDAFKAIANKLPPASKRKAPKALPSAAAKRQAEEVAAEEADGGTPAAVGDFVEQSDGTMAVITKDGPKGMFDLSESEWAEMYSEYGGLQ